MYIDTRISMPISPSKSRDLADEIFFFDGMEMIRNNRIAIAQCNKYYKYKSDAGTHVNQCLINLGN